MPNKYRHIGIVISDGFVFFIVVVGPVVGRYAIDETENWRFIYYGGRRLELLGQGARSLTTFHRIYCRNYLSGFLVPSVSSSSTSKGRALAGRLGWFGLCRRSPRRAWCGAHPRWYHLHSEFERHWNLHSISSHT